MTHPAADPLFLELQLALAGSYSLVRELGRGGMGIVFLAREVHLDRLVAIKLLPPERATDPEVRERFLREARLAAKLSHPHIIPIHAVAEARDFVYFVMSYIDGETLTERVRRHGPLSASDGARVLREVAWALAYAHGQGVVHRDIKPDNILLETASGRALVADFGIAHVAGDIQHAAGDVVAGTPEFMSPEQCLGQPLDARSDLYSLGATAFYMFTGRFPFQGRSATEVIAAHVTMPAPTVASVGQPLPRKIAAVIDRCLAKDPAQRPTNAGSVAEQLGVALEQRREVPAALRSFVKRARLNGGGTLILGATLVPASAGMARMFGATGGWATFALGALGVPLVYFVTSARKLLRLGFERDDLGPAFTAELERAREELGSTVVGRSRTERALEGIAKTGAVLSLTTFIAGTVATSFPLSFFAHHVMILGWRAFGPVALVTVSATLGALAEGGRSRDVDGEIWARMWGGRIGRAIFSVARRFVGGGVRTTPMTHRATELALGIAAAQLYEALPKATRDALRDLPDVLRRLQNDAQMLRGQLEEVQDALNDAGDAAASDVYDDLRSLRDTVHARLGEVVARLETIRLDLLRLHTGSMSVAGVTTNLRLASDASHNVARLISAQGEVARLLAPRGAAATPA